MSIAVYIVAILMGLMVLAPIAAKNNENAQKALEQMAPFQGFLGVAVAVFGIIALFIIFADTFYTLGYILYVASIFALCIILIVIGFLRGYTVFGERLFSTNEQALEKANAFREKWDPRQSQLGYLAVGLGLLALLINIT